MSTNKTFNIELTPQEVYLLYEAMCASIYSNQDMIKLANGTYDPNPDQKTIKCFEDNAKLFVRFSEILCPDEDPIEDYIDTFGFMDFEKEFPMFKDALTEKLYDVTLKYQDACTGKESIFHRTVSSCTEFDAKQEAIELHTAKFGSLREIRFESAIIYKDLFHYNVKGCYEAISAVPQDT